MSNEMFNAVFTEFSAVLDKYPSIKQDYINALLHDKYCEDNIDEFISNNYNIDDEVEPIWKKYYKTYDSETEQEGWYVYDYEELLRAYFGGYFGDDFI